MVASIVRNRLVHGCTIVPSRLPRASYRNLSYLVREPKQSMASPAIVSVEDLPTSEAKWVYHIILLHRTASDSLEKVGHIEEDHLE